MTTPLISIVIPYRNRAEYLQDTLRSIAGQPYRPLSVILVDNGSTDRSSALCRKFADSCASDAQLEVVLTEETKPGAAAARNKGLSLCRTEFVYFFDSDDWFDCAFLPSVIPHLNEAVDLLAVPLRVVRKGKVQLRRYVASASPGAQILCTNLSTQAMVFRTAFLRRIGGWGEDVMVWNDWELGIRSLMAKPRMLWLTNQAFHRILIHDDSITGSSYSSRVRGICHTLTRVATMSKSNAALLRILYLRSSLLEGVIRFESSHGAASVDVNAVGVCRSFIQVTFTDIPRCDRLVAALLRSYVSVGGQGAWLLALKWAAWRGYL